jgi:small subunit ribosomal protein S16
MKMMGRKHRPFFRICAIESRNPRDGRVLEELGTYDPMIPETDARVKINGERVKHWIGVGALPSHRVGIFVKKYGLEGTHLEAQRQAIARLAMARKDTSPRLPPVPPKVKAAPAEGESTESPAAETPAEG